MSSDRRVEASRRNGSTSQGPVTAEGKAKSAMNALRNGLTCATVVLTNESQERFNQVLESYMDHFQPEGDVEADLVEELAVMKWRQRRAWSIEAAALDLELERQRPQIAEQFSRMDEPGRLTLAHRALSENDRHLHHLDRHETRLRRTYERALHNLYLVQSRRPDLQTPFLQNEPSPEIEHSAGSEIAR